MTSRILPASACLALLLFLFQLRRFSRTRQVNSSISRCLHSSRARRAPRSFYSDLFENVLGGTLSDRLLVTYVANSSIVDVQFASDPATIALPPGASNFANLVENGAFQPVSFFQAYVFQVRSDRADVPAPATLLLLGSGLAALGGATWSRCRRA